MNTSRTSAGATRSRWLDFATLCGALLLAACGGGDDEPVPQAPTRTQVATALVQLPEPGVRGSTGRALDLAIEGDGMFVTMDEQTGQRVFTRYGRFDRARDGALIDSEGRRLMGRSVDALPGTPAVPLTPIDLVSPPRQSSVIHLAANLDARLAPLSDEPPFDTDDPNTFNNATGVGVFDQSGRFVSLTVFFRRVSDSAWHVFASANGQVLEAGRPVAQLEFWPDGRLRAGGITTIAVPATTLSSGAVTAPFDALKLDLSGTTQYGILFAPTRVDQDGYPAGALYSIEVTWRGDITAHYGNGQKRAVGLLLLAKFTVADRFGFVGERGWSCAASCSEPLIEQPGLYLLGHIVTMTLER